MANSEVRVVVEYVIEMPSDILLSDVDDFIKNEINEGDDSDNIKSRIVTDVAFADMPGIVEKYHIVHRALDTVGALLEDHKKDAVDASGTIETIRPFIEEALDETSDDEDEDAQD